MFFDICGRIIKNEQFEAEKFFRRELTDMVSNREINFSNDEMWSFS